MTKGIMRGILSLIAVAFVSVYSASAQSNKTDRFPIVKSITVKESLVCNYPEIYDYKHAHFDRSIHDRRDDRYIIVESEKVVFNPDYKDQTGAQDDVVISAPAMEEKVLRVEDPYLYQSVFVGNYKHKMGTVF